jgi:hypothetical protein
MSELLDLTDYYAEFDTEELLEDAERSTGEHLAAIEYVLSTR